MAKRDFTINASGRSTRYVNKGVITLNGRDVREWYVYDLCNGDWIFARSMTAPLRATRTQIDDHYCDTNDTYCG